MRRDAAALKTDVLLVPHHESRTSSTPAFIAAAVPAVAVDTPGYRNRFGHLRPETVARSDEAGITSFAPTTTAHSPSCWRPGRRG
jgi:competence protein ComEC